MSNTERIHRIRRMEEIYDRSCAAVEELLQAAESFSGIRAELNELKSYYASPLWLEDLDADRAGKIPTDMKRGILTEDAIYDLLTDLYRMEQLLGTLTTDI